MRNLLGRLNGRSMDELASIAAFWRVPFGGGAQHRLVGALYRTMTDPRAGRDVWERLNDGERDLINLLAGLHAGGGETSRTVADIVQRLSLSESAVQDIAARLHAVGIIARDSEDEPLPIGTAPRLFLPIEIAQLFRRVRDERDLGDLSDRTFPTLLGLLDDTELEEAAGIWGFRAMPGLFRREDLISRISELVADPDRRRNVIQVAARRPEAARLLAAVLPDSPSHAALRSHQVVPLDEAVATAGLAPPDGDNAAALRLRATLGELESRLLVWHTYDGDGDRFLFVPAEIRDPRALTAPDAQRPKPVPASQVGPVPWRSPDALAWDLLTLLRALGAADAPAAATVEALPRAWLRWLNERLWWQGREVPPAGYLAFLVALARDEGLLAIAAGSAGPALTPTAAVRPWRGRSFPAQTAQLRLRWLSTTGWPEGAARADLAIEGADWRGFRRRLLAHLGDVIVSAGTPDAAADTEGDSPPAGNRPEPKTNPTADEPVTVSSWYAVEDLADWLTAADPTLLGDTFTAATAGYSGTTEPERRRAVTADAIAGTLRSALSWFGLVDTQAGNRDRPLVRIRSDAFSPGTTEASSAPEHERQAPLSLTADGTIRLRQPSPVRVWSLLTFAEPQSLGEVSTWRLTEAALGRALAAGFELDQVTDFLTRQSRRGLPEPVTADLRDWSNGFRRVRLTAAIVLRPDDPAQRDELERLVREAGLPVVSLPDGALAVTLPDGSDLAQPALAPLLERLRGAGFHPARG